MMVRIVVLNCFGVMGLFEDKTWHPSPASSLIQCINAGRHNFAYNFKFTSPGIHGSSVKNSGLEGGSFGLVSLKNVIFVRKRLIM